MDLQKQSPHSRCCGLEVKKMAYCPLFCLTLNTENDNMPFIYDKKTASGGGGRMTN